MFRKRIKDLVHESNLISGLHACRSRSGTTNQPANMACLDVHVRICEQEILKYDLEIKALVQVRTLCHCYLSIIIYYAMTV
jgi:hypothetical protein